jgi:hypothetical protein
MEDDLRALLVHDQEELFRALGQALLNQGTHDAAYAYLRGGDTLEE